MQYFLLVFYQLKCSCWTQSITVSLDPTQANPIQPNPWMDPTDVHLCVQVCVTKYRRRQQTTRGKENVRVMGYSQKR